MSDKYCLLVWGAGKMGSVVHRSGKPFTGDLTAAEDFRLEMESLFPESEYRLVYLDGLKREIDQEAKINSESEEIVKREGNKVTIKAGKGYCENVGKLAVIKDNGNGYTVKFPSYSSVYPDIYMSLDYSQAEYLLLGLREFAKDWKQD